MKRVTGIGGIFFKTSNVQSLKEWYRDHLGFVITQWGATLVWGDADPAKQTVSRTEWSPFKADTNYFEPSTLPYMMNYRVADLDWLLDQLRQEGVQVMEKIERTEYGDFGWIVDPEGRKMELWEPVDEKLGDSPEPWTSRVTGLGGVFFKSENPKEITAWYAKHLGIGESTFRWKDLTRPDAKELAQTVWSLFKQDTNYFAPSEKPYMFNYRVNALEALMIELKKEGVETVGKIESSSYGKFGWIMDPDGNKVELWEP